MLIYLVLVAQFRSFLDPLIILGAAPLGLLGVLFTLLLTGVTLNIQSMMGTIMMIGIAVSNSILVVEFTGRLRREGRPLALAAVEAAATRLRPILMTSIAAILGLLPMSLHRGDANMPLARAVIGGLGASTLLTLFVVPVLYTLLHREGDLASTEESSP